MPVEDPLTAQVGEDRASGKEQPRVLVIMGVSGTGKSTVGGLLAGRLGWAFEEGDDLHPPANVAEMASGHPLTDADRWPWLRLVAAWIDERLTNGQSGIITCSALKRAYRDTLRRPGTLFVYLHGDRDLVQSRLSARHGHYMPPTLLHSQLADLEPPGADENAIGVDVSASPADQAAWIIDQLDLA